MATCYELKYSLPTYFNFRSQVRFSSADKTSDKNEEEEEYEPVTYDWNQERVPHKWYPDWRFLKEQQGPYYCYDGLDYKWKQPGWHEHLQMDRYCGPIEKKTKALSINFGPQHPAAHGVLRLILELEGEVGIWCSRSRVN